MLHRNKTLMAEFNPVGLEEGRAVRLHELLRRREAHARDAWHFLTTGLSRGIPPYGKEWNREYNPLPYPDARPDPDLYEGTGIGALYGMDGSERHLWQLAGWNLVRTGSEHRRRAK